MPDPRAQQPSPPETHAAITRAMPTREGDARARDLPARIIGRTLGVLIVAGAIVLAVFVTHLYYVYPRTDDAYVRANIIGVAPHVSGPIVEMPIQDNQHVKQGQLLFVVDPRPYQSVVDKAEADLALTNLQISALGDAIHSARSREVQLQAERAYDKQYLDRIEPLLRRHFVTANDVFNARSRLEADEAGVASAHSEVSKAQNDLGQYGDINARRKAAEAALYDAKLNVEYCHVRAPFDAYVTNLNIAVGQYANEGREVLSLVDNRTWYVLANFRENFLGHIRPGMKRGGLPAELPEQAFSRPCSGGRMGALSGQRRERSGIAAGGGDAQLGSAFGTFPGSDYSRKRRSRIPVSNG